MEFGKALDQPTGGSGYKQEDEIELMSSLGGVVLGTPVSSDTPLNPELVAILQAGDTFMIQQKVQWAEALTQGCFEQQNIYTVTDQTTGRNVLLIQEESQCLNRCCCAPEHSFFAKFYLLAEDGQTKKSEQAVMTLEREGCDCCFTGTCRRLALLGSLWSVG